MTLFKTKHARGLAMVSAIIIGSSFSSIAQAQVPDQATTTAAPGRVEGQFKSIEFSPEIVSKLEIRDLILQAPPEGAENIIFILESINFEGLSAYSEEDLAATYKDKIGSEISLADLYGIASSLTNKYRNEGYILTQVVVPPQTIDGGQVNLRIVEGYIDTVTVEGDGQESALEQIRAYAANIRTGKALNVKELERHLLLINDISGVEARSVLSPSDTQTGAADLRIIIERDEYDMYLAADNFGSRYLGVYQATAAASANSYFGNNERITGQFVYAPGKDLTHELAYGSASYQQPIFSNGMDVTLFGSYSHTEPGYNLDEFNVRGHSSYLSAATSYPVIRSRTKNFNVHSKIDWRNVRSANNIQTTIKDRIRAVRAGFSYDFIGSFIGNSFNALNVEFSQGLDIFGASGKDTLNKTRSAADPDFSKVTAEIQRLQRLSSNVNLYVSSQGQWSNEALFSSEEFGVGGINYGRSYDPAEIIGDSGVAGKIELQWNTPTPIEDLNNGYQLFAFYDIGQVWDEDASTSSLKKQSLASAGAGVRAYFTEDIETGLGVAFPLTRDVESQKDKGPRFYFNISRKF